MNHLTKALRHYKMNSVSRTKSSGAVLRKFLSKKIMRISLMGVILGCIVSWTGTDLQKYGPLNLVLNSRIMQCNHDRSLNLDVSKIKIYFFDFANNRSSSFCIEEAADGILNMKKLNKTRQFVMFVGGFTSHINHTIETQVREAYTSHPDSYLIIPDHSAYTNNNDGDKKSYQRSVTYVHYIGKALGNMLARISKGGVSPKKIHCVGHSLGGQMLGHTGSAFTNQTGEKITRITALDPAGPCFASSAKENQVRSGVADYVEVFHSNAGALGSSSVLGDVDFIMNKKGEVQPHCETPIIPLIYLSSKAASCNHRAVINLWTAAVKNPSIFSAYKCDSYKNFKKGKCVSNEKTIVGPGNPGNAVGEYYLSTEQFDLKALM